MSASGPNGGRWRGCVKRLARPFARPLARPEPATLGVTLGHPPPPTPRAPPQKEQRPESSGGRIRRGLQRMRRRPLAPLVQRVRWRPVAPPFWRTHSAFHPHLRIWEQEVSAGFSSASHARRPLATEIVRSQQR